VTRLRVIIEADGGARGNPGPAGYGAVVREAGTEQVLAERAEAIGIATNNVAEYSGLIAGLHAAAELDAAEVEVRMDSKLVVEQMSGRWQIKHPGLRPLAAKAAALMRNFDSVTFGWIPRERNKHADRLANEAMDAAAGKPVPGGGAAVDAPLPASPVSASSAPVPPVSASASGPASSASVSASSASGAARPSGKVSWSPPTSTPTRLLLVRHGETTLTRQGRYSGRGDAPLTPHGIAQARAVADRVAALVPSVSAVVSSPLSRCTRTAEFIAAAVGGLRVDTDDNLIECDFGAWEGKTFVDVQQRWGTELDEWLGDPSKAPPGGESFRQVETRALAAVDGLRKRYVDGTVVVVSHVSPIKLLLRDALAASDALLYRLYLDPAGVSIVDSWPDGGIAVRAVNDTAHLPEPPD
jgi:probable phosphoglycerate mutase